MSETVEPKKMSETVEPKWTMGKDDEVVFLYRNREEAACLVDYDLEIVELLNEAEAARVLNRLKKVTQ
jgi:hypothetical protein